LENVSGVPAGALRYIGVTTTQPPEDTDGCVAIIPATGATAGSPGTWTPANAAPPENLADLQAGSVLASPATLWTVGQHVILGDDTHAHWTGTAWAAGDAPA
jgi:hypothetical protein